MGTHGRGRSCWIGAALLLLMVAATGAEAGAIRSAPRYTVTDLGDVPGGAYYTPYALNNAGQAVGEYVTDRSNGYFLYSDGRMQAQQMWYPAINDAGETPALPGDRAFNNLGHTVGRREFRYPAGTRASLTTESGTIDLGALDAASSEANALNDRGHVVGTLRYDDGSTSPFLYSDGVMTDLSSPGSQRSYAAGARDINNRGQVVGAHATAVGIQAFLYGDGEMELLGALGGIGTSDASAINEAGQVVGTTSTDSGSHGFLYQDGVMFDLNDLIPPETEWTLRNAADINDLGQILVRGSRGNGGDRALLLTPQPVPEPSTLASLAALGLAIAWKGRRRGRAM